MRNTDSGQRIADSGYRNAVLIYNPRAGRLRWNPEAIIGKAAGALNRAGIEVAVVPTAGPGTAGGIARERIAAGAELVIAAGGDGVINETIEGMAHCSTPLAILPAGTANVLATELKLGRNLEKAATRLGELRPRRVSLGHITCDGGRVSRHFLLMAGAGFDAHIVYKLNSSLKARAGKLAYWAASWSQVGRRLPQILVETEGRQLRCSFALFSKVRNYGGDFEIASEASLFDARFEAVLFEGRSAANYVKYFLGMGLRRLGRTNGVTFLKTARATLTCPDDPRVYVQIDGEFAGRLPAEIHIVPDALTLLVPPEYGR